MTERMIFNVFTSMSPSHVSHGLWRLPEAEAHRRANDLDVWVELARIAERGKMDAMFFADAVGTGGFQADDHKASARHGMIPMNDPSMIVSALAAATEDLGFMFTSSVLQDHPFDFARRISTLDHFTDGRVGWNIVTSYSPNVAHNFGLAELPSHDERYGLAEEYMEVVYKLWEGSWEDGALVLDSARGVLADPDRVHKIDHVGERFRVEGPHLSSPSPQRTPLLVQAGASPQGRAFAARHAEIQFLIASSPEKAAAVVADVRSQAVGAGRRGRDIRFMVSMQFVVGSTEEEAERKFEERQAALDVDGLAAHFSALTGVNATALDLDAPIDELRTEGIQSILASSIEMVPDGEPVTLGNILRARQRHGVLVGTPEGLADQVERWRDAGIGGLNVMVPVRPHSLLEFVYHLVPELQRRGLAQSEYAPGTMREKLFGAGDRLPDTHPASAYRRGGVLAG